MNIFKKSIVAVAISMAAFSGFASADEATVDNAPKQTQAIPVSPSEVAAKANYCTYQYQYFCNVYGYCSYQYVYLCF